MGRAEESLAELEQALALDPISLSINASPGGRLYHMRGYDPAIKQSRRTLEIDPNFLRALITPGGGLSNNTLGVLITSPRAALSSPAATPRLWTSDFRPVHGIWRYRLRLLAACLEPAVRRRDCNKCLPDAG